MECPCDTGKVYLQFGTQERAESGTFSIYDIDFLLDNESEQDLQTVTFVLGVLSRGDITNW